MPSKFCFWLWSLNLPNPTPQVLKFVVRLKCEFPIAAIRGRASCGSLSMGLSDSADFKERSTLITETRPADRSRLADSQLQHRNVL